jgi:hypothetical protein
MSNPDATMLQSEPCILLEEEEEDVRKQILGGI